MPTHSPSTDSTLAHTYTAKSLEYKVRNKTALQEEFGWPQEPKRAMLCIPAGVTDDLGGALLEAALPGILTLPVEIVVLGKGTEGYGKLFTELSKAHPHRIAIVPNTEEMRRKMLGAADMALFTSDPKDLSELKECLSYGVVPVAPVCGRLEDYNPNQETGNAFVYAQPTPWHCFGAAVRALETYRFPFDWRTIQRHGMEQLK